jgi:hypothetical protein
MLESALGRARGGGWRALAVAGATVGAAAASACVDTVHDDEVAALGPEIGSPGPEHRPGQPCLVCHGGSGPADLVLSTGGTVVDTQGQTAPAVGAIVTIEDVDGNFHTSTTNDAGNFYVTAAEFTPHYPTQMTVSVASPGPDYVPQSMLTHSSREGSCAACHQPSEGPSSPGPVYLNPAPK